MTDEKESMVFLKLMMGSGVLENGTDLRISGRLLYTVYGVQKRGKREGERPDGTLTGFIIPLRPNYPYLCSADMCAS